MRKIARLTKELEDYNQNPAMNQLEQVTSAVESTHSVFACSSSASSSSSFSSSSSSSTSSSPPSAIVDEQATAVRRRILHNHRLSPMKEPTEMEREQRMKRKELEKCFNQETWKSNRQIIQDPVTSAIDPTEGVAANKKYWEKWKRKRHRGQDRANSAKVLACSSSTSFSLLSFSPFYEQTNFQTTIDEDISWDTLNDRNQYISDLVHDAAFNLPLEEKEPAEDLIKANVVVQISDLMQNQRRLEKLLQLFEQDLQLIEQKSYERRKHQLLLLKKVLLNYRKFLLEIRTQWRARDAADSSFLSSYAAYSSFSSSYSSFENLYRDHLHHVHPLLDEGWWDEESSDEGSLYEGCFTS